MPGTIRKDSIDEDHRVDVYCDLHRKVSSVKALSGVNKGRVIDKPRAIVLEDVRLRVSQAAVCKVRETGVRSVHTHAAVAPSFVHRASEIGQTRSEFATTRISAPSFSTTQAVTP